MEFEWFSPQNGAAVLKGLKSPRQSEKNHRLSSAIYAHRSTHPDLLVQQLPAKLPPQLFVLDALKLFRQVYQSCRYPCTEWTREQCIKVVSSCVRLLIRRHTPVGYAQPLYYSYYCYYHFYCFRLNTRLLYACGRAGSQRRLRRYRSTPAWSMQITWG